MDWNRTETMVNDNAEPVFRRKHTIEHHGNGWPSTSAGISPYSKAQHEEIQRLLVITNKHVSHFTSYSMWKLIYTSSYIQYIVPHVTNAVAITDPYRSLMCLATFDAVFASFLPLVPLCHLRSFWSFLISEGIYSTNVAAPTDRLRTIARLEIRATFSFACGTWWEQIGQHKQRRLLMICWLQCRSNRLVFDIFFNRLRDLTAVI